MVYKLVYCILTIFFISGMSFLVLTNLLSINFSNMAFTKQLFRDGFGYYCVSFSLGRRHIKVFVFKILQTHKNYIY